MNRLSTETRVTILNLLIEGSSIRSISRVTGASPVYLPRYGRQ